LNSAFPDFACQLLQVLFGYCVQFYNYLQHLCNFLGCFTAPRIEEFLNRTLSGQCLIESNRSCHSNKLASVLTYGNKR
jgi:hypothetical protein